MKRTPLRRRKPLKRGGGPADQGVPPRPKRRRGLRPISARRRAEQPARADCRRQVLERDPFCRWPGCTRESSDVHELQGGSMRAQTYLDPRKCVGLCRRHHDQVEADPVAAHEVGLNLWSWEKFPWE